MELMVYIKKAVVAFVGFAIILLHRYTGIEIPGIEPVLVDAILSVLSVFGVYQVTNGPKPT